MIVFEYHYCDLDKEPCKRGSKKECPMHLIDPSRIADKGIIPQCEHFKMRRNEDEKLVKENMA